MAVDDGEGRRLLQEVANQQDEDRVLEDLDVIAGVKGMTVVHGRTGARGQVPAAPDPLRGASSRVERPTYTTRSPRGLIGRGEDGPCNQATSFQALWNPVPSVP